MALQADRVRAGATVADATVETRGRVVDLPTNVAITWRDSVDVPTVAIVGLGYVGLPTAIGLHATGAPIIGLDVDERRHDAIRGQRVDLVAEDRDRLRTSLGSESFRLTRDATDIAGADVVIVCVPTPVDEHLIPDMKALDGACATVVANARAGQTIILTSTSYVGSTRDLVAGPLTDRGFLVGTDVHVAFSPERIDPGNVRFPQSSVPRVVGGITRACAARAAAAIGRVAPTRLVSSPETAEFTKLYENAFRAVNIAFANEMETVSRSMGLEFSEIVEAAATKPFGFMPFRAGTGVGGHCIPCDPHYLLWQLDPRHVQAPILDRAMRSIAERPSQMVERAIADLGDRGVAIRGALILLVGVTYKPGIDDVRESPAIDIIRDLLDRGARVAYADPRVPVLDLGDGRALYAVDDPAAEAVDLVIVHALHPGLDHTWLADRHVVDPSGRAADLAARRLRPANL